MMGYRDDYTRWQSTAFLTGQGAFNMATARVLPPRALRDIAMLVDPVNRRYSASKSLDYVPGFAEGIMSNLPGVTKALPPSGRPATKPMLSPEASTARMLLMADGLDRTGYRERIDKEGKPVASFVRPELIYKIPTWKVAARWGSANLKAVPKLQYRAALAGVDLLPDKKSRK